MNAYNVNIYTDDGTIGETIGFSEEASSKDKSSVDKSSVDKSSVDKSSVDKSSVDKSSVDKSSVDKSSVDKSSVDASLKTSKYHIHKDDSIMQIKNKILLLYPKVSYDEIYVFAKTRRLVNLALIYQNIAKIIFLLFNNV